MSVFGTHWQTRLSVVGNQLERTVTVGKKFQTGNAYSLTEKKNFFLSVNVDDMKLAWKETEL